jgi:hypothetical protein
MASDPSFSSSLPGGWVACSSRVTDDDHAGSQGTTTSLLPSWAGTSDASGSGGFGGRQTRVAPALGGFIGMNPV